MAKTKKIFECAARKLKRDDMATHVEREGQWMAEVDEE